MMNLPSFTIRPGSFEDADALNRVIESAIMTWKLPERVKRLSLPSYRYDALDLDHLQVVVATGTRDQVLGVAAWEPAEAHDCPSGKTGLLIHGLYVDPAAQHRGIGSALLNTALQAAREAGVDGLLVKAQADAVEFFLSKGMQALPVEDPARHYANRLWEPLDHIDVQNNNTPLRLQEN